MLRTSNCTQTKQVLTTISKVVQFSSLPEVDHVLGDRTVRAEHSVVNHKASLSLNPFRREQKQIN